MILDPPLPVIARFMRAIHTAEMDYTDKPCNDA